MKNKTIQSLKGLGILLVVLYHSQGVTPAVENQLIMDNTLFVLFVKFKAILVTFVMPLFFFISGFLYFSTNSNFSMSWMSFLKKKTIRLLIPYIAISSIAYPLKVVMSQFAVRPVSFSIADLLKSFFQPWNNTILFLWFLTSLFLIMLFSKLLLVKHKSYYRDIILLIISLFLYFSFEPRNREGIVSILNLGGSLHFFIFFLLGANFCKYFREKVSDSFTWNSYLLLIPFLVCLLVFFWVNSNPVLLLFMALSGMLMCYFIAQNLPLQELQVLGQYSYQIYLLSWFPQIFVRVLLSQIFFVNIWLNVFLSLLSGLLIPIFVVKVVNKYKLYYFRIPFGM